MTYIKPKITEAGQHRAIVEAGDIYTHPLFAFKEYPTNGLDAIYRAMAENGSFGGGVLDILIDSQNRRVLVRDDGTGMPNQTVKTLPERIFEGDKFDRPNERGEKGIGLTSFISLGGRDRGSNVDIISKVPEESQYGRLNYSIKDGRLYPDFTTVEDEEMEKGFGGGFEQGTKVVLNLDKLTFNENFKNLSVLKRFLRETYSPLLMRSEMIVCLGSLLGEKSEVVSPMNYPGVPLLGLTGRTETYQAMTVFPDGSRGMDTFPVQVLLFADPTSKARKVGVYTKDVNVYDSVTRLLEKDPRVAALPLWSSGHVSGFINNMNLSLVLGRDGIRRGSKVFKKLVDVLEGLNDELWPQVESLVTQKGTDQQNQDLNEAWNVLRQSYKTTEPIDIIRRVRNPPQTPAGPREPRKPREIEQEGTHSDSGRRVPFRVPILEDFDLQEEQLRSRLGENLGDPTIFVNSAHPDYTRLVVNGKPEEKQFYLVNVMAAEAASFETENAVSRGSLRGSPVEISQIAARRAQDLVFNSIGKNGKGRRKRKDNM